eukprot:g2190.t1
MKIQELMQLIHKNMPGGKNIFSSAVPESCRPSSSSVKPSVVLGIDEAGRGPVLGPMVYGAAYWRLEDEEEIKKLGYDDSKALSKEKRDDFFKGIVERNARRIGWILRVLSAEEISAHSLAKFPVSLNQVSHAAAIEMIQHAIKSGVNVRKVFVDTVGHPGHYERMLGRAFEGAGIQFVVRKKADSLFPVVSAASICAKQTRDHLMDHWTFEERSVETNHADAEIGHMGSGYPGDERTKKWLAKNMDPVFGFPSLIRFNWSTARDMIESESTVCDVDWPKTDDDVTQTSITAFLQPTKKKKRRKRSAYFESRGMGTVCAF